MNEPTDSTVFQRRYRILFAIMFGILMAPIDASMVNVILPTLTEVFQADIATAQWIPMIYLLIISSLLLFFGRLGDVWGYKKVFLFGLAGFVVSSGLCGCAPGIHWLIVFRAVQAIGAAMMMAVPLAMITACFPVSELGRALGTYSISISAGLAIGPSFGGLIASLLGWRFTFLINLPIGIVALFVANRTIPDLKGEPGKQDFWGTATFFVFSFLLLMFVNRAQAAGLSGVNSAILLIALTAGVSFVFVEKRSAQPMLDLSLFRNVTFSFASLSALLNYMAQYVVIFLTPFHLHRVLHLAPNKIGLIMTSYPLAVMAVAPFSGWLADRTGVRAGLSCLGSLICSFSMLFLAFLQDSATAAQVSLGLVIFGVGTGIFQSPNTSAAMGGVARHELGVASSILAAMRNVGMVMGIAMAGAILHALVANEILEKHALDASESGLFAHGLDAAFIAGAVVSTVGAVTSLVKK